MKVDDFCNEVRALSTQDIPRILDDQLGLKSEKEIAILEKIICTTYSLF